MGLAPSSPDPAPHDSPAAPPAALDGADHTNTAADASVIDHPDVLALLGVGFGPTHLALAIAFSETHPRGVGEGGDALFLEKKPAFSWHAPLLLPQSRMQISFLKDLATFRNPCSRYTFLAYLHACGADRLAAFSNVGAWTPSREEWAGYLAWAAKQLEEAGMVCYETTILAVEPVFTTANDVKRAAHLRVTALRGTEVHVYRARNVSVGVGAAPYIPRMWARWTKTGSYTPVPSHEGTVASNGANGERRVAGIENASDSAGSDASYVHVKPALRDGAREVGEGRGGAFVPIAHTSAYLPTLARMFGSDAGDAAFDGRFCVVGGGQSSAEVWNDLALRFPRARVDLVHRTPALVPADSSPFVNSRAFDPASTSPFFRMRGDERGAVLRDFRRANYACVEPELLATMYERMYRQRVARDIGAPPGFARALQTIDPNAQFRSVSDCVVGEQPGGAGRYRILANAEVVQVDVSASNSVNGEGEEGGKVAVELTLRSVLSLNGGAERARYDAVFLGTGYHRPPGGVRFLAALGAHSERLGRWLSYGGGEEGYRHWEEEVVGRDYAVVFEDPEHDMGGVGVFLLGSNERTHGLSDSLLSVGAVRAGEVVSALRM